MIRESEVESCEAFLNDATLWPPLRAEGYFKLGLAYFQYIKGTEFVLSGFWFDLREKRFGKLLEAWNKSIGIEPDNLQRKVARANFNAYFIGDYSAAQAELDQVAAAAPHYWRAYAAGSQVRARTHDVERSIADAQRAVELAPDQSEAYSSLGFALSEAGYQTKAIAAYETATGIYKGPDHFSPPLSGSDPWLGLAQVYQAQGNPGKAADVLTTRIAQLPQASRPLYLQLRARANEQAGRFSKAADDLAIAQPPSSERQFKYPPMMRVSLLIKALRTDEARAAVSSELQKLTLSERLALQIQLNSVGYKSVQPTGNSDDATLSALLNCFDNEKCLSSLGRGT